MPLSATKKAMTEREELLEELHETQRMLNSANARFDLVTQPELIDQCVYEINALKARHAYYMRVLRQAGEDGV